MLFRGRRFKAYWNSDGARRRSAGTWPRNIRTSRLIAARSLLARGCGGFTAVAAARWHPIPRRNRTSFLVADSTPSTAAFAYLYIADSPDGAIAETICRDLPLDPTVARIVPASAVTGRTLTALTLTHTVTVAALHGRHLSAVGQDLWLTKCEARHYVITRRWAHAIQAADSALGGLAYRPRYNEDTLAWVLTTDPAVISHPALTIDSSVAALSLDRGRGRDLVERIVADHSAIL